MLVEFSDRCDVVEAVGEDVFSGSAGVIRRTVGIFLDQTGPGMGFTYIVSGSRW